MARRRNSDDENLDALARLSDAAGAGETPQRRKTRAKQPAPKQPAPATKQPPPAPPKSATPPQPPKASDGPRSDSSRPRPPKQAPPASKRPPKTPSEPTSSDDETIPLSELVGVPDPPPTPPTPPRKPPPPPSPPPEPRPARPPLEPMTGPAPTEEPVADERDVEARELPEREPAYRCLHCGYPMLSTGSLQCTECGKSFDRDTLEHWLYGDEESRFEHVIWLILAILFLKLLLLPQLLSLARLGGAVAIGIAGWVTLRGKQGSIGGYFASATIVVAVLMGLMFAWGSNPLPYFTLDMISACLLLLGLLYDPVAGAVGGQTLGRRVVPILLFAVPLFGIACYVLAGVLSSALGAVQVPEALEPFHPLLFILPYLASAALWVLVWRTVVAVRNTLFRPNAEQE